MTKLERFPATIPDPLGLSWYVEIFRHAIRLGLGTGHAGAFRHGKSGTYSDLCETSYCFDTSFQLVSEFSPGIPLRTRKSAEVHVAALHFAAQRSFMWRGAVVCGSDPYNKGRAA